MTLENPFYEVRKQMEMRGGEFVRALSIALGMADSENRERIIKAFPEIMMRYDAFATLERERQPTLVELEDEL